MTMLEIFESRLPEGVEIKKATHKGGRYDVVIVMDGTEGKAYLPKTCIPGEAEKVADFTICAAMMDLYFKRGDIENIKLWLEKQNKLVEWK